VLFTFSMVMLNREEYKTFKVKMVNHLCFKLDPLLNFGLNCYDFYRQSRYESMLLEESRLTPLAAPFAQPLTAMSRKPNIIFFQVESFRADLIGQERQGIEIVPNLNRLARQGTWFKNAYAGATHTSLSNPSIPSSLYPLRKDLLVAYQLTDPWPRTLIYDVLKPYGYATAYIASDIESWCGMDNFLMTPSLDLMLDATSRMREQVRLHPEMVHGNMVTALLVPDRLTARSAIDWMDARVKSKQPFYITISLSDSHFPYKSSLTNANWFQPCGVPANCTFNDYPRELKEQVRNTYFNSIHGIDILIGQILDSLHQSGADENTIFVVYGDHGESFYENDLPSHGNLPYDPSARTCLIMTGKNYFDARTEIYPASLIDAVPTVLARLGLQPHPNFQGIDVLSPNRPPLNQRCLYVHVDGLVNADGVVAAGRWKYFEDNGKGDRYLYDLAHDPGEAENLIEAKPDIADVLSAQLADWRTSQLVYYRAPRYYTKFYPPRPQMLKEPGLP
jgi:lipoteichoic acid synthase